MKNYLEVWLFDILSNFVARFGDFLNPFSKKEPSNTFTVVTFGADVSNCPALDTSDQVPPM